MSMCTNQSLVQLIVILCLITEFTCKFEFTNIKCNCVDEAYCALDECYLKSINRTYKYLSIKVHLLKPPITNVKVRMAMFKRYNGYKPFLYNITFDGCKVLKNRKYNPVANYFLGFFEARSNMNHSCPYDHDIIVDKLPANVVDYHATAILPFPEGNYLVESNWYVDDIERAAFKIYGTLS
ncbi:uncharacterized protein LOC117892618 [Drosophila subobscura]|uniref:uncharacterized protein LOC117892618 n=1 Tax=Drosophila subobscura TaxID=7241 RepID=UPI00155B39DE|nr:uncharacterized protein LOC117892618 [Drosophila subobscura]